MLDNQLCLIETYLLRRRHHMKKSIQVTLSSIIIASSMHSYCYADTIPTNKSLTGKGVKVAVIDSGIDVTHPDLKQNYVKGYDFLDNDTVPEDRDGHGTHVAGIIAANGAMKGIAPDASILAYRVWGGSRGGPQAIIKAIEQAIKDGAQIINLSLGENIDGTDTPLNQAIRKAINRNITVVVAAGNAGPTQWSIHSLASTPEAITVGNAKAQGIKETILQIPGIQKEIGLHLLDKNQTLHTGEYGIVYLHDFNLDNIQKETDFKNKIVVIENADFNGEQAMNTLQELQKRGAVAILDSLNDENQSVKQYASLYRTMLNIQEKIPVLIGISKEEKGMVIKAAQEQKIVTILNDTEARVDSSSSHGPTVGSWGIKPDLAAPGVDIESTFPLNLEEMPSSQKTGYAIMSGTSMAAPYVTGAAALLKQEHPDWTPYEIRAALTSTTTLLTERSGQVTTPLAQGSGQINIEKALRAEILPLTNNLNFGFLHANTGVQTVTQTLRIENVSNKNCTLSTQNQLLDGKVDLNIPEYITIPAYQTIEIPVKLQVDTSLTIDKHIGLISLGQGEEQMHIPYIVSVDPKDYPFLSIVHGEETVSRNQFPYLLEYDTPFPPKQLTISITGHTVEQQPFSATLMDTRHPSKGYQQFKWDGKDKNKKKVPKGTYTIVITAKYNGKSYEVSHPLTIK